MATAPDNPVVLSSDWGNLSPHLIASFWPVDRKGKRIEDITVKAAITESNLEMSLNWSSPFENQGAQNITPTLQQMVQSGSIEGLVGKADSVFGSDLQRLAHGLEGRTAITKLNNTQVFVGAAPATFNVTALFRAWKNPVEEVHKPFDQLMKWVLPVELSEEGSLAARLLQDGFKYATTFPSIAPVLLAVKYKDATYWPLVIESISKDTNSPVDKHGKFVELTVPMKLTTLAAIDRADWSRYLDNNIGVNSGQRR